MDFGSEIPQSDSLSSTSAMWTDIHRSICAGSWPQRLEQGGFAASIGPVMIITRGTFSMVARRMFLTSRIVKLGMCINLPGFMFQGVCASRQSGCDKNCLWIRIVSGDKESPG